MTRQILSPNVHNYETSTMDTKVRQTMRKDAISKHKSTCRYCGLKFDKYLMSIDISSDIDVCCKFCYNITHLNNNTNNMKLGVTDLSQTDIVHKTVQLVINNQPLLMLSIDPNVQLVDLSIKEYVQLLYHYNTIPKEFDKVKIFFVNGYDVSFLQNVYSKYIRDEDDDDIVDEEIEEDTTPVFNEVIEHYKLTDGQINVLKECFGMTTNELDSKMNNVINTSLILNNNIKTQMKIK